LKNVKKNDRNAQKILYDVYSPVMYGLCLRYVSEKSEASDILQEGFLKILTKITDYTGKGSFEGWMKRVIINTAITSYHKNKKFNFNLDINEINENKIEGNSNYDSQDFTIEELENVIKTLPTGYKIVFNMFAIEGYKHKEIAEELGIDENTSKSQFLRARKVIQHKLEELSKIKIHDKERIKY